MDKKEMGLNALYGYRIIVKEHPMIPENEVYYQHKADTGYSYDVLYVQNIYHFIFLNPLNMYPMSWEEKLDFCCSHALSQTKEHIEYFVQQKLNQSLFKETGMLIYNNK